MAVENGGKRKYGSGDCPGEEWGFVWVKIGPVGHINGQDGMEQCWMRMSMLMISTWDKQVIFFRTL